MNVNISDFDKLNNVVPKSILTKLTKRVSIVTTGCDFKKCKSVLDPGDSIEFTTCETKRVAKYIWTGRKFVLP